MRANLSGMASTTGRVLRRRLRRLDTAGLARFVAALWATTGWSTAVRGRRVIAERRDPRRERRVLAVVAGPGSAAATLFRPPSDADLLVAPVGHWTGRALAGRTGLSVVDANDLAERLTYAVDAEARDHLLGSYLPGSGEVTTRRAAVSMAAVALGVATAHGVAPRPPVDGTPEPGVRSRLDGVASYGSPAITTYGEREEKAAVRVADEEESGPCRRDPRALATDVADVLWGSDRVERVGVPAVEGDRATVPVTAESASRERAAYRIELVRTERDCWRFGHARAVERT